MEKLPQISHKGQGRWSTISKSVHWWGRYPCYAWVGAQNLPQKMFLEISWKLPPNLGHVQQGQIKTPSGPRHYICKAPPPTHSPLLLTKIFLISNKSQIYWKTDFIRWWDIISVINPVRNLYVGGRHVIGWYLKGRWVSSDFGMMFNYEWINFPFIHS